jgi:hypothetical protein
MEVLMARSKESSGFVVRKAICELESMSPYSQSRAFQSERGDNEPHDKFDERCWRERMHVNEDGVVFVPPLAIKNGLTEAAGKLDMSVPGAGKKKFKGLFASGIMCLNPMVLDGVKATEVVGERLYVPSNGRSGDGTRVYRRFPHIPKWSGKVEVLILDERISDAVFKKHMEALGVFVGLGRFRPARNGFYGRFNVKSIEFKTEG